MARKKSARYQHLDYEDSIYELRHARARVGCTPDYMVASKLLEEDDSIDEVYKIILLRALDGRDDPWKEKTETCDVIGQRRKANALKKRKRNDNITELDDDCNVEEEADPEYELFLRKLKGIDQSSLLKFEKGDLPLIQAIRCKVDRGCDGDDIVQIDKQQAPSCMDHWAVEGLRKSIHPAQTGEKNKAQDRRKFKKVARQGDHKILYRGLVQFDKDHFDRREKRKIHQDPGSRKSRKKTAVGNCAVKKEPDHSVKTRGHIKEIHCQISYAKCASCSAPLKKSNGNYLKGERNSKTVPAEVEILDSDMIAKKRIFSPFIPSIKHVMMDEELKDHGLPSASNEFRKEVLKVLRRPFDKEEYKKCREEVRDKSYTYYYPGLQTKLTKFRYKMDKCLIVLRGFFFWLQNLTREGSFKPWLDKECLTMELPSR